MTSLIPYDQLEGRRVGFNIDAKAVADWSYLHSILRSIQPRFNLVMDNSNRAVEVANLLPNSLVSGRFYHPDDAEYWKKHTPQEAVNYLKHRGAHPHRQILWEVDCEPSTAGQLANWLSWSIRTARACRDERIHYVTAIATGKTIEKHHVLAGVWDAFIRELHENEYFHLGVHGYGQKDVQAPYMAGYPANLINGDAMNPAHWPTSVRHTRTISGELPDNWHLWREDWLQIRSVDMGYERIPYVWSEGIHDNMDDVSNLNLGALTNHMSIKEFLKTWNNGKDVKGIPSLAGPWAQTLVRRPDITISRNFEDIAASQIEWTEKNTPPECVGISLFSFTLDENWILFRLNHLKRLHGHMEKLPIRRGVRSMASTPLIETPTEFARFMIETTDEGKGLRVRSQPNLSGIVYGSIPDGKIEARVHIPKPDIKANGYSWVYVKIESPTTTLNGWTAAKKLTPEEVYLTVGPHPLESGEVPVVDPGDSDPPTTPPDEPDTEPDEPPDDPPVEDPTEPEPPHYGPEYIITDLGELTADDLAKWARNCAAQMITYLGLNPNHIKPQELIEFAKTRAQERAEELLAESNEASSPATV